MDCKARFYDSRIMQFQTPDTLTPEPYNPRYLNRYSYTLNNPIRYNDPSGHCPLCLTAIIGGAIGAIVGAVGYTVYVAATGQQFNAGHMLLAAGGGALAGALIGTGVGLVAGLGVAEATVTGVTAVGVAEAANTACGGDMCASEAEGVTQSLEEASPALETAVSQTANEIQTGTNTVYQMVEDGVVKYYGITNNFFRRAAEHLLQRGWSIEPIEGLENLSRFDARSVEQVLIEQAGLDNLYNQINSIATSNPVYNQAVQRGLEILKAIAE
jgi:hypothetical protein